jgi:predicted glycosyltransferase
MRRFVTERPAGAGEVRLHTFVPDLPRVLQSVDAVVRMGGYNTLVEAISKGVRKNALGCCL